MDQHFLARFPPQEAVESNEYFIFYWKLPILIIHRPDVAGVVR